MNVSHAYFWERRDGRAMRPLALAAAALLLAGVALLGYAAAEGDVTVALVLVFPVILGTGPWAFLGGLLLIAGVIAGFAAYSGRVLRPGPQYEYSYHAGRGEVRTERWPEEEPPPAPERKAGGFVLIGPIPIAFGSTRGLAIGMLLLALLVLAFMLVLPLLLRGPA